MKTIKMTRISDGELVDVPYDPTIACLICGNPVVNASIGGFDICPSCDCGYFRNGKKIENDPYASLYIFKRFADMKEKIIPKVWSFQEVHTIASLLAARGIHAIWYELSCQSPEYGMDIQEGWFMSFATTNYTDPFKNMGYTAEEVTGIQNLIAENTKREIQRKLDEIDKRFGNLP